MAESAAGDFAARFAESEGKRRRERRVAQGDVVRGRVIAVGATAAFVAVGDKAEATIELGEFRDPATGEVQLHEGDEIEATVVDDGTCSGSIVLKRVAGRGGHVPGELEQAFAHGIAIEGLVSGENKGGYDVQIGSVRAFCPGSQLDRRRTEGAQYVGQRLRFRSMKLERDRKSWRGRVGLSRRTLAPDPWATAAERFPVGASVCGTVRRLEQFGAFVERAPGLDGLVHVSRLALDRRVSHPRQIVSIGDTVDVTVVELDPVKRRIGLSMVERAAQAKEAAEGEERGDTAKVLAQASEKPRLGTLADLLTKSPKPKR